MLPQQAGSRILARADEFLVGAKNKKDHRDEYYALLNDVEKVLESVSEGNCVRYRCMSKK